MVTAVWGGLVASMLGGSEFNIVGPTGALSGILSLYAVRYGAEILPFLCLLSGMGREGEGKGTELERERKREGGEGKTSNMFKR
jgi:hypothetical protein